MKQTFPNEKNRPLLEVRRASGLYTNRLDHYVGFDSISGSPFLIVQSKRPEDKAETSNTVSGQLLDYLLAMQKFGHPNPFAALTAVECSRLGGWMSVVPTV
jgi:hypothetical protein